MRVFRLSRIRGKVSYATKAEHDFRRPADFDPRAYANRADWQLGEELDVAEVQLSERIAWQVERHFGRYGTIRDGEGGRARLPDRLLEPARPDLVGARPRRERPPARPRAADGRARAAGSSCSRRCTATRRRSRRARAPRAPRRHPAPASPAPRRSRSRRGETGDGEGGPVAPGHRDPARALRAPGDAREHPDQGRARRASG